MHLGRGGLNVGFGTEECPLRGIELHAGGPTLGDQHPLAVHVVGGFRKGGQRRGVLRLRCTQGILLRLRVELGDKIA